MSVSIRNTLSLLPSGAAGQLISWDQVSKHLRETYDTQGEKLREARHRLRDELYADGGVAAMNGLIDTMFVDATVREMRKRWVPHTRFNNSTKRIVNEKSTVYSEPALREVEGDENNRVYQDVQERCRQAEQSIRVNRMFNLHGSLLVGFRVRELADGEREPVIDIATPSVIRAAIHPNDSTQVIGWLIRVAHRNIHTSDVDRMPSWVLWTDHEKAKLNENLYIIGEPEPHGFARNPWVPITRGPVVPGFWHGDDGEDLVAAHMAIWFAGVCMMKELKSATNQTVLTGDLTAMARGQAMDTETPVEAPDGVGVSTVDMSMDVSMFGATADHVLERVGMNHGLALAQLKHQGVQSADARELMRVPLREIRLEQQVPLRAFERRFAEVQSMVLKKDMAELAFSTEGWSIDFGESQTPLSERESADLYEKQKSLGLTNPVDFLLEKNPDLTEDQVVAQLERNVEMNLELERLRRPLYALDGQLGALGGQQLATVRPAADDGAPAAENTPIQEMAS